jgi:hypothetical protein
MRCLEVFFTSLCSWFIVFIVFVEWICLVALFWVKIGGGCEANFWKFGVMHDVTKVLKHRIRLLHVVFIWIEVFCHFFLKLWMNVDALSNDWTISFPFCRKIEFSLFNSSERYLEHSICYVLQTSDKWASSFLHMRSQLVVSEHSSCL